MTGQLTQSGGSIAAMNQPNVDAIVRKPPLTTVVANGVPPVIHRNRWLDRNWWRSSGKSPLRTRRTPPIIEVVTPESKTGGVVVTLRRRGPAAPATYPQNLPAGVQISTPDDPRPAMPVAVDDERRQRAWELERALEAARVLQARLELLGDRALDVAVIVSLRHSLARELVELGRER